ncbi:hypothetical protein ASPZODRAFT_138093 [Penicilliopsis zonata CBS 506.65]|uniref:Major facilitator superfamily (MFS) profile domain-containing protein n=1 Tax=Penicilliopsis zonata CBS 506.65 TaxID=1073090 RepID=A0A1L9SUU3_9EURO|nr:hypothetical protein ASPZODRAFT_138093 [Penicilliopsis zonata CBS 506.65]OJJ50968.1 hypothetical protein ASPZODRAFT_138093 [Penicilliopsis zonata CBS 506.65]
MADTPDEPLPSFQASLPLLLQSWLSDLFGRRFVLFLTIALTMVGAVIEATAPNWKVFAVSNVVNLLPIPRESPVAGKIPHRLRYHRCLWLDGVCGPGAVGSGLWNHLAVLSSTSLPRDYTGRSYAQLDEMFINRVPTRKFSQLVCSGDYGYDLTEEQQVQ